MRTLGNFKCSKDNQVLDITLENSAGFVVATIEVDSQHIGRFYPVDLSGNKTKVPVENGGRRFFNICVRRVRRMLQRRKTFFRQMVVQNKGLQFI